MKKHYFSPPGMRVIPVCFLYGALLGSMIGRGCLFFSRFFRYRDRELYETIAGVRFLSDRKMADFNELAAGCLNGLWILFVACVLLAVMNYLRVHQESKSIYVMKRISRRAELHERCLTIPVSFLAVGIVLAVVLYRLYLYVYFHYTPEGRLPEYMNPSFWRALL